MTRTVGLGALRGAAAGAAAVGTAVLLLATAFDGLNERRLEGIYEFLVIVSYLPAAVLAAGLIVGAAVRLRGWWAVGLVAPGVSLLAANLLPDWPTLQVAVVVLIYAAAGAAGTALITSRQALEP